MLGLGEKRYAYWEEVNEGILRQFSPGRGLVLDVGCGSGALAEAISRRGYTVWGIERDATALAAARGRLARIIEADIADAAGRSRFRDCRHRDEPGCGVQEMMRQGALEYDRYQNYMELRKEAAYLKSRSDEKARMDRKRQEKELSRRIKEFYRDKK